MRSIAYKWDSDTKGHVDVSEEEDVRSLRCLLSKELGLPASQGLRLKCGSRDLRDGDRISAIGGTVHAMPHGGLAGGAGSKRPAKNAPLEQKKRAKATLKRSAAEVEAEAEAGAEAGAEVEAEAEAASPEAASTRPAATNEGSNADGIAERGVRASVYAFNLCKERVRELDDSTDSVQVTRDELLDLKRAVRAMNKSIVHLVKESHMCEKRHTVELHLLRQAAMADEALAEANRDHEEAADVDADAALRAAITTYQPNKKFELQFTALITATRSRDVACEPLTADSERPAVEKACETLADELGNVRRLSKELKARRDALQSLLAYPPPQLVDAFIAALSSQGGGDVEMAVEAELAVRRVNIALALIKAAAAPAHVKLKDLFRRIRDGFPDAWVASCGALLAKANAALDTVTADGRATGQVPSSVVAKWETALIAAHGEGCKFKSESQGTHKKIKGAHIYRFELS